MNRQTHHHGQASSARGFTLIELMVAMLLGLIVIAGVGSVFLANQRTYRTNHALGDVQDGARMAFELMARDVRDAGLTGCGNGGRISNVLNNPGSAWWKDWSVPIVGHAGGSADPAVTSGGATGNRVAATDSLTLLGGEGMGYSVQLNTEPGGTIALNEADADLVAGDVVIVCDPDHAVVVQANAFNAGTITHGTGAGNPGNSTADLGFPAASGSYVFPPNSLVTRLRAATWYIGNNPDGGRSLYRMGLVTTAGVPTPTAQEMVRNVTNMTIAYHQAGQAGYVAAGAVGNWALVDAVSVRYWLESTDQRAGTDAKPLRRDFIATTTIRNRVS